MLVISFQNKSFQNYEKANTKEGQGAINLILNEIAYNCNFLDN